MKYKLFQRSQFALTRTACLWTWLLLSVIVTACLFFYTTTAQAFPLTQCAANRYGSNLGCTAKDVQITNIRVVGDRTSCVGGTNITVDLEITVNFGSATRYDAGIFISNDGKDPQLTVANGGAASCSVGILPTSSPFLNLDSDGCGDGNKAGIGGGTGSGVTYMTNVTVPCQALSGSGGNLYIPFVVSWNNQSGLDCYSIADPVPGTSSKCNAPTITQGTISVVVLPTITNTDGIDFIKSGNSTAYTVVITNSTGVALSNAVFKDPSVTNINVSSVSCSGAACPCVNCSVADMQGAGITIPSMPAGSSVTFTINATLTGTPPDTLTNTASVTVGSQTNSASDTDTIVETIAIIPSSLSKSGSSGTLMVFNYILYNFSGSSDTISLSASSNQGWPVQLSSSSLTVAANGTANFTVTVQIPAGAAIGTLDTTTITATSGNDSNNKATATAVTTVLPYLTLAPNNTGSGGKNSSAFYDHRVQNNTASSQTVTFSISSNPCGWTVGFYKSDKVTQIPPATVTLPPFGGYEDIAVKVTIPSTAASGTTCTVTVTASAGGNTASATDATTVKDIVLYSDPGFTDESYIFPLGNAVYAEAYGTLATTYNFYWYDSSNVLRRTSPDRVGPGTLPDTYNNIPIAGPLGTWRVEVRRKDNGALFVQTNFYVGPDHLNAIYTGTNPVVNTSVTIPITLHDRNHVVPIDPSNGNVVQGNPPITKDPLKITVTVSGSATITAYCNDPNDPSICSSVSPTQTVTFNLPASGTLKGTATITITDSINETVTITPSSYNSALYGSALSPTRDESTTVTFVKIRKIRILDWREIF